MDLLDPSNARARLLTKARPKSEVELHGIVQSKESIKRLIMSAAETYHFYAATLTIDKKVKSGTRFVYRLPTVLQIRFVRELIPKVFNGFVYIGFVEFTQKDVIHVHLLVAHPTVLISNSTVRSTISRALGSTGKNTYVQEVNKLDAYVDYIMKEFDVSLPQNVISSTHIDIYGNATIEDIQYEEDVNIPCGICGVICELNKRGELWCSNCEC